TVAQDLETRKRLATLTLEVAWVPGLTPLWLETRPQGLRLLDAEKKEVSVPDEGSSLSRVEGEASQSFDFTIPAPPRSQPRIGLVEGRLTAITPTKMLTFTFDTL